MKKKYFFYLLPVFIVSCSGIKSYPQKHKYYEIAIISTGKQSNPIVYGKVTERGTQSPVHIPNITLNTYEGKRFKGDFDGNYKFSLLPGRYKFLAVGFPYPRRKTKYYNLKPGDSVRIDFYLTADDRPLD